MKKLKTHLSKENQKRLAKLKTTAQERILKREFVQFRVSEPMMDLLLKVANHKREMLGVMVRHWTEQRLAQEAQNLPLIEIKLSNGKTLTESSSQEDLEKAVLDHQHGVTKLTNKQYRALMDWLMDRHLAARYSAS